MRGCFILVKNKAALADGLVKETLTLDVMLNRVTDAELTYARRRRASSAPPIASNASELGSGTTW